MKLTKGKVEAAEKQIYRLRKLVGYDIRELTIEIIVGKYKSGIDYDEEDESDDDDYYGAIYVPEYQRDFTWDKVRQSRLIESILLGLPIPLIFVAENKNGTWEIVDGSQRIRTLNAFLSNELELKGLQKLQKLNSFSFNDLPRSRRNKFVNVPIRMIVLSENATDEVKKDMFERINRGSDLLKPMEKRKGIYLGPFRDLIYNSCAQNSKFTKLAPIDTWLQNRQEKEELILRYFALSDKSNYKKYPNKTGIAKYLDKFLDRKNKELDKMTLENKASALKKYEKEFNEMVDFVDKYFKFGFRINNHPNTKRVVFEAISVGVHAFLSKNSKSNPDKGKLIAELNKKEFHRVISGNKQMHKPDKINNRVEFVIQAIEIAST